MIKHITIEVQGKEISLTLEEAKQLKQELDGLFNEPYTVTPWVAPYPEPYTPWKPLVTWGGTGDKNLFTHTEPNVTSQQ